MEEEEIEIGTGITDPTTETPSTPPTNDDPHGDHGGDHHHNHYYDHDGFGYYARLRRQMALDRMYNPPATQTIVTKDKETKTMLKVLVGLAVVGVGLGIIWLGRVVWKG